MGRRGHVDDRHRRLRSRGRRRHAARLHGDAPRCSVTGPPTGDARGLRRTRGERASSVFNTATVTSGGYSPMTTPARSCTSTTWASRRPPTGRAARRLGRAGRHVRLRAHRHEQRQPRGDGRAGLDESFSWRPYIDRIADHRPSSGRPARSRVADASELRRQRRRPDDRRSSASASRRRSPCRWRSSTGAADRRMRSSPTSCRSRSTSLVEHRVRETAGPIDGERRRTTATT